MHLDKDLPGAKTRIADLSAFDLARCTHSVYLDSLAEKVRQLVASGRIPVRAVDRGPPSAY